MNIETWKVYRNSVALAQVLSFLPGIEQTKVTTKALDGSVYIQTIGEGTKYAEVTIFATRAEMKPVNLAEADGAAISVDRKSVV